MGEEVSFVSKKRAMANALVEESPQFIAPEDVERLRKRAAIAEAMKGLAKRVEARERGSYVEDDDWLVDWPSSMGSWEGSSCGDGMGTCQDMPEGLADLPQMDVLKVLGEFVDQLAAKRDKNGELLFPWSLADLSIDYNPCLGDVRDYLEAEKGAVSSDEFSVQSGAEE